MVIYVNGTSRGNVGADFDEVSIDDLRPTDRAGFVLMGGSIVMILLADFD
jgi:hypothetical protein